MKPTKQNPKTMSQGTNKRMVQPYLSFEGRCEEALEFYRKSIGAEVTTLLRYKDSPDPGASAPGTENKVMHATLRVGESTVFASDGRCGGTPNFQGIWLALTAPDEADAQRLFDALADGGQVQLPLTKTFFSPRFGMVTDRLGVSWVIQAATPAQKG
jgi:PhnB protein